VTVPSIFAIGVDESAGSVDAVHTASQRYGSTANPWDAGLTQVRARRP
jgi:hypothetical protein